MEITDEVMARAVVAYEKRSDYPYNVDALKAALTAALNPPQVRRWSDAPKEERRANPWSVFPGSPHSANWPTVYYRLMRGYCHDERKGERRHNTWGMWPEKRKADRRKPGATATEEIPVSEKMTGAGNRAFYESEPEHRNMMFPRFAAVYRAMRKLEGQ